jgi:membrane associated rhomboid family serine protease
MFQSIWQDIKSRFQYGDTLLQIILINIIVFVGTAIFWLIAKPFVGDPHQVILDWLAVPSQGFSLSEPSLITRPWTVITYMFLHIDLFHIFFNMLILYWFGQVLANYLGNHRILPVYVIGGVFGFLIYFISANLFPEGMIGGQMLGASAGVMAIVMAAASVAPTHVFHLILIGPVQIRYIALFFILLDLLAFQGGGNTGGHLAHLGGVFWGFLFVNQLGKGNDYSQWFNRNWENIKNFFYGLRDRQPKQPKRKKEPKATFSRKQKPKNQRGDSGGSRRSDMDDQSRVDAILDKIKESGYENLTKEEKDFLFKISKEK